MRGEPDDLPEWFQAAVEEGELRPSVPPHRDGLFLSNDSSAEEFVGLGDWVISRMDGSLFALTAQRLAEEYDLIS